MILLARLAPQQANKDLTGLQLEMHDVVMQCKEQMSDLDCQSWEKPGAKWEEKQKSRHGAAAALCC